MPSIWWELSDNPHASMPRLARSCHERERLQFMGVNSCRPWNSARRGFCLHPRNLRQTFGRAPSAYPLFLRRHPAHGAWRSLADSLKRSKPPSSSDIRGSPHSNELCKPPLVLSGCLASAAVHTSGPGQMGVFSHRGCTYPRHNRCTLTSRMPPCYRWPFSPSTELDTLVNTHSELSITIPTPDRKLEFKFSA